MSRINLKEIKTTLFHVEKEQCLICTDWILDEEMYKARFAIYDLFEQSREEIKKAVKGQKGTFFKFYCTECVNTKMEAEELFIKQYNQSLVMDMNLSGVSFPVEEVDDEHNKIQ